MDRSAPRSLLFVPGDRPDMLEKVVAAGADAIIADLEDAVGESRKDQGRAAVRAFLEQRQRHASTPRVLVRINSLSTPHWTRDLDAVLPAKPDGLMLPKPRSGADVTRLSDALDAAEAALGLAPGVTAITAIATERAISLLEMASYAGASPRLVALAWGSEDLSAELGARSALGDDGTLGSPFRLARDLCLVGAAAAGVAAIDQVYVAVRDLDGLRREAEAAARDGFAGKMAIHPAQVPVINAAFTPTAAEVRAAEALVAAFEEHGQAGAFVHEGRMVDAPHLARARQLLSRARGA